MTDSADGEGTEGQISKDRVNIMYMCVIKSKWIGCPWEVWCYNLNLMVLNVGCTAGVSVHFNPFNKFYKARRSDVQQWSRRLLANHCGQQSPRSSALSSVHLLKFAMKSNAKIHTKALMLLIVTYNNLRCVYSIFFDWIQVSIRFCQTSILILYQYLISI